MPGMSGAEFVRELRKTRPKLPVLVISGMEEAESEYEGMNVLFRLKPLLPENLLASVQSLIGVGRAEAEPRTVTVAVNDALLLYGAYP